MSDESEQRMQDLAKRWWTHRPLWANTDTDIAREIARLEKHANEGDE